MPGECTCEYAVPLQGRTASRMFTRTYGMQQAERLRFEKGGGGECQGCCMHLVKAGSIVKPTFAIHAYTTHAYAIQAIQCAGGYITGPHLSQLEDVLFPINDFEAPARQPCAYIASVKPAILIQTFPCLLLILEVALEHIGAPYTNLHKG